MRKIRLKKTLEFCFKYIYFEHVDAARNYHFIDLYGCISKVMISCVVGWRMNSIEIEHFGVVSHSISSTAKMDDIELIKNRCVKSRAGQN